MFSSWHVGSCQMRTCSAHFRPLRGLGSSEHVSRVFARIFVIISIFAFSADFYDFLENKLATPSLGESGERANPWSTPALAHSSRLSPSAPRARSISRECRDTGLGGAARREKNNNTQQ